MKKNPNEENRSFRKKFYAMFAAAAGSIYGGGFNITSERPAPITEQKHVPVELVPSEQGASLDDYFKANQDERRKSMDYMLGKLAAENEPQVASVKISKMLPPEPLEFVSTPVRGRLGIDEVPRDRQELQEAITNLEDALKPYANANFIPRSQADKVRVLSEKWLAYMLALRDANKADTCEKRAGYSVRVDDVK